mgnify:CR=1 FL=1
MLEKLIVKKCKDFLENQGCVILKSHGGSFGTVFAPDLYGVCHGVSVWIEVKQPGKKPTRGQQLFLERLERAGAVAFWTDSLDGCKTKYFKLVDK